MPIPSEIAPFSHRTTRANLLHLPSGVPRLFNVDDLIQTSTVTLKPAELSKNQLRADPISSSANRTEGTKTTLLNTLPGLL
jgi:hypothetical protein